MIGKQLPKLELEKRGLEQRMSEGDMAFEELQKTSERNSELINEINDKELRWLELSEIENTLL